MPPWPAKWQFPGPLNGFCGLSCGPVYGAGRLRRFEFSPQKPSNPGRIARQWKIRTMAPEGDLEVAPVVGAQQII